MRSIYRQLALAAVVFAVACNKDVLSPREPGGLQPARLTFYADPPRISVPEVTTVGTPTVIGIESYGGGCIASGPTPFELKGDHMVVSPLDRFPEGDPVCTSDLRYIDHSIAVRFDKRMTVRVSIHGTQVSADHRAPLTVEETIIVR